MVEDPKISVIIPWCNRNDLQTTLSRNEDWVRAHQGEILLVNCGGDPQQLARLLPAKAGEVLRQIHVPRQRFNKALALNLGAYFSCAPRLFVLDADIIVDSELITKALQMERNEVFMTVKWVSESVPALSLKAAAVKNFAYGSVTSVVETYGLEFTFRDGSTVQHIAFRRNLGDNTRTGTGLIMMKKQHFLHIGGYNSELELWGWEDDDIQIRLKQVLHLERVEIGEALHLTHGDDVRALYGESRRQADIINFGICCSAYSAGNFLGTYHSDVAAWKERATEIGM